MQRSPSADSVPFDVPVRHGNAFFGLGATWVEARSNRIVPVRGWAYSVMRWSSGLTACSAADAVPASRA